MSRDPARELLRLDGARLRLARLARGLTQADLANAAGVTRQAIAGIEAGRWDPSLRVALAFASGLGVPVEDLFGSPRTLPPLDAELAEPILGCGVRVELANVASRQVALPLIGDRSLRAGFVPASGVTGDGGTRPGTVSVTPTGPSWRSVVVAGCDPALPLLMEPLAHQNPPLALSWWPCSSRRALELAAAGLVHAAGIHLADVDDRLDDLVSSHLGGVGAEVIGFASWSEGLLWRPPMGKVLDLAVVSERHLRFVNRDPGSEARSLVDSEAARLGVSKKTLVGYDSAVGGHLLVASAVAAGIGDVGISIEPAAIAYGLAFTPLALERSHLVVPTPLLTTTEVQGLLRALAGPDMRAQLSNLAGYESRSCGDAVATI